MNARMTMMAAAALLALGAAGCIFSPDDGGDDRRPPPPPVPFPDTPDQLIENFKAAYTEMDVAKYRDVLHTDFRFLFTSEDIQRALFPTDPYNRDQELEIADNIFSGRPGQDHTGAQVLGISQIQMPLFNPLGPWSQTGPTDPEFPNSQRKLYQVEINFIKSDNSRISVRGQQEFYVVARDSVVNGVTRSFYQLRGQRDLTESN